MEFNLKIYDINNEQKKSKKIDKIIIKSQIYFLVYDINNSNTLKEVTCMTKIIENCKNEVNNNWIIVVIANKKDLSAENKLNDNDFEIIGGEEQGEILAKKNNALFFKTTAKEDKEIKDIIGIAVEKLIALP